ncbi:MAG: sterol desaturase family protein [Gammaproteobacteria bacterium]|nr:sterol desaturase family protein [Gammaproteobacteria bacterium]
MNVLDITPDSATRLSVFALLLIILSLLEVYSPRRKPQHSKARRWINNFGISALSSVITALALPLVGVAAALWANDRNWGLFNQFEIHPLISVPLYVVAFDFTIYLQHRAFHRFSILWRLHRVHHTDLDYDVSTGVRFHPLSILISSAIKIILILLLGPLAVAVLISEIVLNATSMFNHSNIKLSNRLDKFLRYFIVTPDMHRIHHSVNVDEHSQNFGFNFTWWDRLLKTYKEQPVKGHNAIEFGIHGYSEDRSIGILSLLTQPFTKDR